MNELKLASAKVGPYKSTTEPQELRFEEDVTVLVGQNEAGKSAILEALNKANASKKGDFSFDATYDYPRKDENRYRREHPANDTEVVRLTYRLSSTDRTYIEQKLQISIPENFEFSTTHHYNNEFFVDFRLDEQAAVQSELTHWEIPDAVKTSLCDVKSYPEALEKLPATEDDKGKSLARSLQERIKAAEGWNRRVASYEAYGVIKPLKPAFLYFSDYNTLPGKTSLADLRQRKAESRLESSDRTILALLNNAGIDLDELLRVKSYEETIARLQGFSIEISDRVFEFWKQNTQLEVEFDVRHDPTDRPPFNVGPNLYIRIKNNRHRVSVPFDQRSRGFIWFFSFLVWFDDAQAQAEAKTPLILLLDEPGLNLHALAQADFLAYIDHLGETHQVLYTTHSPFLVESDKLHRVRVVEDRDGQGTTISDRLDSRDPKSIFPLQAALGYTIAQSLFISDQNLLVEGPTELLFLQAASAELEAVGRISLHPGIVLVPVGGLDKVATFIALLAGNKLRFAVCVDKPPVPDQRLKEMVASKIINAKALLDFSIFRNQNGTVAEPADVEDMFGVTHYLDMFNRAYAAHLNGAAITEKDLPSGSRIVERIARALENKGISVRPSGGFNHYLVANRATAAGMTFEPLELNAFEALFRLVNSLLEKQ